MCPRICPLCASLWPTTNAVNRKVAVSFLKRLGFQADAAVNGIDLLERVRGSAYDEIVLNGRADAGNGRHGGHFVAFGPSCSSRKRSHALWP